MMKKLFIVPSILFVGAAFGSDYKSVPGEIIVKFKKGHEKNFFSNKSLRNLGLTNGREVKLSYDKLNVLKITNKSTVDQVVASLKNNPDIEYAEPNFIYSVNPIRGQTFASKKLLKSPFFDFTAPTPNDPQFGKLWGLRNTGSNEPNGKVGIEGADVNALKAWDITKGSHNVKIAIIDTGVDYTHPDLVGNVDSEHGFNFVDNSHDAMDDHGHGTHCAGTIGAVHDNSTGVAGVMNEVTIVPLKFLDANGSGTLENAVKAIDYATNLNVDLMSNSWGGGGFSQALFDAIKNASDKGIIFTAAAGNSSSNNDSNPGYPASYQIPNVISVAAMTAQNELASFSSYGRTSVHIAAPGHNILSTVKGGGYEVMSGTSMATPHVSGVIGLLLSKEGRMSHETLKERLTMTGVPVVGLRGKTVTASRIDAYNLLTDTRPERSGPKNDMWKSVKLDQTFESEHPYTENTKLTKTYSFPNAKYVRVKFAKYDLEAGYDYVRVADGNGSTLEKVSGKGESYTTDYIEGNSVTIDFVTDRSINKWGFKIEEVEVQ